MLFMGLSVVSLISINHTTAKAQSKSYGNYTFTQQEIDYFVNYPAYAVTAKVTAQEATEAAQKKWEEYTLTDGNGDAYRHAYWSALLTSDNKTVR